MTATLAAPMVRAGARHGDPRLHRLGAGNRPACVLEKTPRPLVTMLDALASAAWCPNCWASLTADQRRQTERAA